MHGAARGFVGEQEGQKHNLGFSTRVQRQAAPLLLSWKGAESNMEAKITPDPKSGGDSLST